MKCMDFASSVGHVLDIFISCRRAPLKVYVWINFLLVTKTYYEEKVSVNLGLSRVVTSCCLCRKSVQSIFPFANRAAKFR